MTKHMKVLITGGAGFIGSNLCRRLVADGDSVRVLDDLSTGSPENLDGVDVDFVRGTLLDADQVRRAASGIDAIVHLGALGSVPRSVKDPLASHHANATGTLHVLEAAREGGVPHVIFSSSSSVYGANPKLPKDELDWTRPMSPYAASKLAAESYTLAFQQTYGMKTLAFRFFNVYGPHQSAGHAYAAVIPKFIQAALTGQPLEIHGDGQQSRDFTYVDSTCAVLAAAVHRQVQSPDPINLAFGTNTPLLHLVELLEDMVGHKVEKVFAPPRVGDVRASLADPSRLRELFPESAPTALQVGLAQTLVWYQKAMPWKTRELTR